VVRFKHLVPGFAYWPSWPGDRPGLRADTAIAVLTTLAVSAIAIHFNVFGAAHHYFMRLEAGPQLEKLIMLAIVSCFSLMFLMRRRTLELEAEAEKRARSERQAHELATRDPLTGLFNRRFFVDHLNGARERAVANGGCLAVLLIDLDRFKPVNDLYGHEIGDHVLFEVGARLERVSASYSGAMIARMGGDEFACVIEYEPHSRAAEQLAGEIISMVKRPISLNVITVTVGSSIGIADELDAYVDSVELLRRADLAMYRAKRAGRNSWRKYDPEMDAESRLAAQLVAELRHGIPRQEIVPYYQPIAAFRDGAWTGFECLARWNHPGRGILSADHFIKPAEDSGLLDDLSLSLLRRACADAQQWPQHFTLSFNISALQLRNSWLPEQILHTLFEQGITPGRLIVELTESGLFADFDVARALIVSLKNAGAKLALDDFGTGYSSLSHLRELPFDGIKIDRSFIENRDINREDSLVKAIIRMAHSLGIKVTAEGVATRQNWRAIKSLGCDYGQGFLVGRPASAADTLTELGKPKRSASWTQPSVEGRTELYADTSRTRVCGRR